MRGRRRAYVLAVFVLVGLAVGLTAAWAGRPGFSSTPTSDLNVVGTSGSQTVLTSSVSSSSTVTGVGILAVFSGTRFGAQDEVVITADVSFLVACVNGSGRIVAADIKKGPAGDVSGTLVITDSVARRNGIVTNGVVFSNVIPWPVTGFDLPSLTCPKGQTETVIGIEFSTITVTLFGTSGSVESALASPSTQTFIDPFYKLNG